MSAANPLTPFMIEAQKIVIAASAPMADKSAAIKSLGDLLCTPMANSALLAAGFVVTPGSQRPAELAAA